MHRSRRDIASSMSAMVRSRAAAGIWFAGRTGTTTCTASTPRSPSRWWRCGPSAPRRFPGTIRSISAAMTPTRRPHTIPPGSPARPRAPRSAQFPDLRRGSLIAAGDVHRAGAGLRMRLAVLNRVVLGCVQGFPVGAAPGLVLAADRQGAASLRLDRMHPALRAGALLQRRFVGFGRRRLVPAGALFAAVLIVGYSAVPGIGRGDCRERQDDRGHSREDQRSASHRSPSFVDFTVESGGQRPVFLSVAVATAQDTLTRGAFLAVLEGAKLGRVARRADVAAPGASLFSGGKSCAPPRGHWDHNLAAFRIARLQRRLVGAFLGVLIPAEAV